MSKITATADAADFGGHWRPPKRDFEIPRGRGGVADTMPVTRIETMTRRHSAGAGKPIDVEAPSLFERERARPWCPASRAKKS